jgi:dGTPase
LQNKTQVFPLPGAFFVHNRLTHSLEVASVGRSLGKAVGELLANKYKDQFSTNAIDFYRFELSDVIQTACLSHDIGNPPFGHFGEEAIRTFFSDFFAKSEITTKISDNQKQDLIKFEGNANAFRILTSLFQEAGLKLTYTTLVSIIKYPTDSVSGFDKKSLGTKKSGFFDSEIKHYQEIVEELGIKKLDDYKNIYAFKLHVISFQEAQDLLLPLFLNDPSYGYISQKLETIADESQKLSLLRAMLVNNLTGKCTQVFLENEEALLNGTLNKSLIDLIDEPSIAQLKKIDKLSFQKIYNHPSVVEKELAGYHVIYGLLEDFVGALMQPELAKSQKILRLIPNQFHISKENSLYQNLLSIVDFISGMTDVFAIDLFRKLRGIQTPEFG